MNPLHARTIEAERRLEAGEPLDDLADVVKLALRKCAPEIPLERHGGRILLGTEYWRHVGAAHYRTVVSHRKSEVWHPKSTAGQISAFEVLAVSTLDPETIKATDKGVDYTEAQATDLVFGDGDAEYAYGDARRASIFGPSYGGSRQEELREAPDKDGRTPTAKTIGPYIQTLQARDSEYATERLAELEAWMTDNDVPAGDVVAAHSAWIQSQYFGGRMRSIKDERRRVADRIIRNCSYFRQKLAASDNELSRAIGKHLEDTCKIGIICEYRGDWPWRF